MKLYTQHIKGKPLVFLLAFLFSICAALPHIVFLFGQGSDFKGVYQTFSDDEIYYQGRIAEVVRGNISIGNPYIAEHASDPFLQPPIAEWIVGGISLVTSFSVPLVTLLGDFIFVFLSFILVYLIFFEVTRAHRISTLYASIFFTLFISTFGRPVSPQVTGLFLFSGLLLVSKIYFGGGAFSRHTKILHSVLGVVTGVTLFVSPYYVTTLALLFFLAMVGKSVLEKSIQYIRFTLPWFLFGFLPFCFLYGFYALKASGVFGYGEAMLRFGLIYSHALGSYTSIFLGLITGTLLFVVRSLLSKKELTFAGSLILSIVVLNWQNVITGKALQFSSHYLLVTILFVLVTLSIIQKSTSSLLFNDSHSKRKRYQIRVAVVGILLTLSFVQWGEIKGLYASVFQQKASPDLQEKSQVFHWFNANTKENEVVYTLGGDYDFLLPVYTHNKVYYNLYATLSVVPNKELENRWLISQIFNPNVDVSFISRRQRDFWMNQYIDPYYFNENRKKIISFVTRTPYVSAEQINPELIEGMLVRYEAFKNGSLSGALETYKVDYLLLSREYPYYEEVKATLDRADFVKEEASLPGVVIYKIVSPIVLE